MEKDNTKYTQNVKSRKHTILLLLVFSFLLTGEEPKKADTETGFFFSSVLLFTTSDFLSLTESFPVLDST